MILKINLMSIVLFCTISFSQTWNQIPGPETGNVMCLAVNRGVIFAGIDGCGIYQSSDTAGSWSVGGMQEHSVINLAVRNDTIFAGTGEGLFMSTDNGSKWKNIFVDTVYSENTIIGLAVIDSMIFITISESSGYLARSADGGKTWESVSGADPTDMVKCGRYLFANGDGIVFSETDGRTWNRIDRTVLPNSARYRSSITAIDTCLFASTLNEGIYKSIDYGKSWTKTGNDIPESLEYFPELYTIDNQIIACINSKLYRTVDLGNSWQLIGTNLAKGCRSLLKIGNKILAATDYGVNTCSIDNWNWVGASKGMAGTFIQDIAYTDSTMFLVDLHSGLYTSTHIKNSWFPVPALPSTSSYFKNIFIDGNNIFVTSISEVFHSKNSGLSWNIMETDSQGVRTKTKQLYSFCTLNEYTFASTYGGIVRKSANEDTWTFLNNGLNTNVNFRYYEDIKVIDNRLVLAGDGIYISDDNGGHWRQTLVSDTRIISLCLQEGGAIYANKDNLNGIYCSKDSGQTWKPVATTNNMVVSKIISYKTRLFTSSQRYGVYISTDSAKTWTNFSESLVSPSVTVLYIRDDVLYAGTWGNGLFYRSLNQVNSINSSIHPNAGSGSRRFASVTTLGNNHHYRLLNTGVGGSVSVFDLSGRIVYNSVGTASPYSRLKVPSGQRIARLQYKQ